jgi:hydroxymethylbilane synthase
LKTPVIIGTRGSELALWQAHHTQHLLAQLDIESELKIIQTKGDQIQNLSFDKIEGKGFFTKEIEAALVEKQIDIAVHSHKDLETQEHPSLIIAAVSEREDPRDLLIIKKDLTDTLEPLQLKNNIRVGTSSVRRKTQVQNAQPNIQFVDIRGNVPTRIKKLRDGHCDALMLAAAGITRLQMDLSEFHVQYLDPSSFVPAPAQGVLAWQCRREDKNTIAILSKIHQAHVQEALFIERTILQKMNGGCQLPLGVYCEKQNEQFQIHVAFSVGLTSDLLSFHYQTTNAEDGISHCLQKIQQWQAFSLAEVQKKQV